MKKLIKYKKFLESISSNIWDLDEYDIKEIFFSLEDENMEVDINRTFLEYKDSKIKYHIYFGELTAVNVLPIDQISDCSDTGKYVIGYSIDISYENDTNITKEFFTAIERLKNLSKEYELKIFTLNFYSSDEEITDYLLYVKEGGFYYESTKIHYDEFSTENILITLIKKTPYTKEEIINSL